jgi:hypothetical protein
MTMGPEPITNTLSRSFLLGTCAVFVTENLDLVSGGVARVTATAARYGTRWFDDASGTAQPTKGCVEVVDDHPEVTACLPHRSFYRHVQFYFASAEPPSDGAGPLGFL